MECLRWFSITVLFGAVALFVGLAVSSEPVRAYSTYPEPVRVPAVVAPVAPVVERVQEINRLESRTERFRVTAYCAGSCCCGAWADGRFADNSEVSGVQFAIAAPRGIALGTYISVPGYNDGKPVRVRDRGGAIKSGKLDVYFPTHQEALEWGVQYLDCEVSL